jgi:hypothetical protein
MVILKLSTLEFQFHGVMQTSWRPNHPNGVLGIHDFHHDILLGCYAESIQSNTNGYFDGQEITLVCSVQGTLKPLK